MPLGDATLSVVPLFEAEVDRAVAGLNRARRAWRVRHSGQAPALFPSQHRIARGVDHLAAALFPQRLGSYRGSARDEDAFVADHLGQALAILREQVGSELAYWQAESQHPFDNDQADTIVRHFAAALAEVRELVDTDVEAAFLGDPAARSTDEILICYPGALAVLYHRLAHRLYTLGAPIVARVISELANQRTGIDIHPGATIGPSFFIDHGTGVVIGETAIIGARVRLYQHVTLGARSPLGVAQVGARQRFARHPIIQDDVVLYAGATLLGRITIGVGSVIGGNVWLLEDVPPHSIVTQPEAQQLPHESGALLRKSLVEG